MPAAARKKAVAPPSGPELFARISAICQTACHSSLTKKGVRLLLSGDFGKPFVEANKDAIGKMVLEAVKMMDAKQKRGKKGAPGTPSGREKDSKRKSIDADRTPGSAKRRATATRNSKANASASTAQVVDSITQGKGNSKAAAPASPPDDEPREPDSSLAGCTKPQVKRQRRRKLDMDQQHRADTEIEQKVASLALPRSTGEVSAVWAAASQTAGLRNSATANAAKRRQEQLERAADAVTAALSPSNTNVEEMRSAARLAAPFDMLAVEVAQLNERADTLETAERARLQEQAQNDAAERQREQEELIRAEKIKALRAERAEIAKAARAARRAQQAKDQKLREWEEERRTVEHATWHSHQNTCVDDPIPEEV